MTVLEKGTKKKLTINIVIDECNCSVFFSFLCDGMNVRRHEINFPGGKRLLRRQSDVSSCGRTCCLAVDTQAGLKRQADKIIFASWKVFDYLPVRCCALDVLCVK
jgi:hypothetical protein